METREITVRTRYGMLRGSTCAGVYVFRGVPYAQAPFGALRFQPPHRPEPWSGVRDARCFGPTAPQPKLPLPPEWEPEALYPVVPGAECLNLNIWSAELGEAHQPVMVWLHGGGFEGGSSIPYDGFRFARHGVVCVTVNYRLGVDGFLDLGDGIANRGLLDQIAALEWVRENIKAFGGNPDNVTVFGQSSGAVLAGTLLAMPRAKGLFRRAILQSGVGSMAFQPETARHVGRLLAQALGVRPTRDAIATVPPPRLMSAHQAVMAALAGQPDPRRWNGEPGARITAWQPVVDGWTLPARPLEAIRAGAGADVDVLLGTNAEEGRLSLVPFGQLDKVTEADLVTALTLYGLPVRRALEVYQAGNPGASPGDLLSLAQRDWWYRAPAYQMARARVEAGAAATFLYEFAWRSPAFSGLLGACHLLEVPFVFDLLDSDRFRPLTGPKPPQELADAMHNSWIAFAKGGDPGWPQYDLIHRPVMRFDTVSTVVTDPAPAERVLWESIR